jgi:putative hydrolase of the HAD superfamily
MTFVARTPIRAIILDAGGVLLHPNLSWIRQQLLDAGITATEDDLYRGYYRMIAQLDCEVDPEFRNGIALTSDDARSWLFYRLLIGSGLPADTVDRVHALIVRRCAQFFPRESDIYHWARPGLRQRLQHLHDMGFQLAVASNNDGALDAQLTSVGVIDLFAVRLDSGLEGVAKPDPELVRRAAARLGRDVTDCLYVGDIDRVDGKAARSAGMHFALLDPLAQHRAPGLRVIADLAEITLHFQPS